MKIKIIDLLNKIANGEEIPKIIKYDDKIYYSNKDRVDLHTYQTEGSTTTRKLSLIIDNEYLGLNEEVKIIEELTIEKLEDRIEKAVEFLETQYNTYPNGEMWRGALKNILQGKSADDVYEPFIEDNKKLEKIDFKTLNTQKEKNRAMKDAINELIDEINKLKED